MKKCPTCNAVYDDDSTVFCGNCGTRLEDAAPAPQEAPAPSEEVTNEAASEVIVTEEAVPTEAPAMEAPAAEPAAEPVAPVAPVAPEASAPQAEPAPAPAFIPNPVPQPAPAPQPKPASPKKKKLAMWIGIGVAAFLVIAILIGVGIYSLFFGGYRVPIRKTVAAINKDVADYNEFVDYYLPKFVIKDFDTAFSILAKEDEDVWEGAYGEKDDYIADYLDALEDEYGDDYKVTYEIKETEKLEKRELNEIKSLWTEFASATLDYYDTALDDEDLYEDILYYFEDEFDLSFKKADEKKFISALTDLGKNITKIEITDGYKVTLRYTIEGSEGKDRDKVTFNVIKVNGTWLLDRMSYLNSADGFYRYNSYERDFAELFIDALN